MIKFYSKFGEEFYPVRSNDSDFGIDLRTPVDIYLPPGCEMEIDTGITIVKEGSDVKFGYIIVPKSSAVKYGGIRLKNTMGVVDESYIGPNDTIIVHIQRPEEHFRFHSVLKEDATLAEQAAFDAEIFKLEENHETKFCVVNGNRYVYVKKIDNNLLFKAGDKFCQMLLLEQPYFDFTCSTEVEELQDNKNRGGHGSTGKR